MNGNIVAVKKLKSEHSQSSEDLESWFQEIKMIKQIKSPYVVGYYDHF